MLFAVDGRVVAQLRPEEKHSFELPAGDHRFEYELGLYNCSADVRIETGRDYSFRLAQGCVIEREDGRERREEMPTQPLSGSGPGGAT